MISHCYSVHVRVRMINPQLPQPDDLIVDLSGILKQILSDNSADITGIEYDVEVVE